MCFGRSEGAANMFFTDKAKSLITDFMIPGNSLANITCLLTSLSSAGAGLAACSAASSSAVFSFAI